MDRLGTEGTNVVGNLEDVVKVERLNWEYGTKDAKNIRGKYCTDGGSGGIDYIFASDVLKRVKSSNGTTTTNQVDILESLIALADPVPDCFITETDKKNLSDFKLSPRKSIVSQDVTYPGSYVQFLQENQK